MLWRIAATMLATVVPITAIADPPKQDSRRGRGLLNLSVKLPSFSELKMTSRTMGGKQLWSDEFVQGGWRIQRNILSNHCRLLDDKNVRRTWGTYGQCWRAFQGFREKLNLPPVKGKVVVALHGLWRSRTSMQELCDYLHKHGDFTIVNVSYASTRAPLEDHARRLAKVIGQLPDAKEIHFVAHSLGNLVVRHYLADQTNPAAGIRPDPRIKRIVMLAPPNNGAQLAERFRDYRLMHVIWGETAGQIADWRDLERRLAVPTCEFGIIAGGRPVRKPSNPLVAGNDDLVLSVEETRLGGARDFLVLPVFHGFIMKNPQVHRYTLRFLVHGHFVSAERRQPIPPTAPRE